MSGAPPDGLLPSRRDILSGGIAIAAATLAPGLAGVARADDTPRRGGTLVAVLAPTEPASLAIVSDTAGPTVIVSTKIFEGLIGLGPNLEPLPVLATGWTVSPDGKQVRFALRPGVRWHDGTPFTSADVKFSLEEVWKKYHPRGRSTFASVEGVDTPDDLTAVFRLSNPSPVIFSALIGGESPILPRHIYQGSDIPRNPANLKPVGTGPFRFGQWVRGDRIELERNPDYWDPGKPYLDRIVFRLIPDLVARGAAFESGDIQYGALSPLSQSDAERIKTNPALVVEYRGYDWLGPRQVLEFNLRRPALANAEVRRAIAHAIDRKGLAAVVTRNNARPASTPILSSLSQYAPSAAPTYGFDIARAEALLDQAGFSKGPDGTRLSLTLDYLPFNDNFRRIGEFIRQSLRRVGIAVDLRSQDLPRYFQRVYGENDFDLSVVLLTSFGDPQIGTDRMFWSKTILKGIPWTNASGYSNPAMDALIEAAHAEGDPQKRAALYQQLQVLALTDLPLLPLLEDRFFTVHARRLNGLDTNPAGSYESLKNAWFAA